MESLVTTKSLESNESLPQQVATVLIDVTFDMHVLFRLLRVVDVVVNVKSARQSTREGTLNVRFFFVCVCARVSLTPSLFNTRHSIENERTHCDVLMKVLC